MATLPEQLELRARLIAHAVVGAWRPRKWEWWGGYDWHHNLHVESWADDRVDYRRGGGSSPTLMLTNVQPSKIRDSRETEPVELESKVIDAASIESLNRQCWLDAVAAYLKDNPSGDFDDLEEHAQEYWGAVPLSWEYSGEFETTRTKAEAFSWGLETSIRNCFTAGSDASAVKNEFEVTMTASLGGETSEEESQRVNRVFSFSGETPAGVNERITAWRKVSRMQSYIIGSGDYEHSIRIGKHWHGRWDGGNHQWDSFADFLRTIKGNAPSNWPLSNEFQRHNAPSWLIDRLEEPLEVSFKQRLEFDQATSVQLRKTAMG